MAEIVIQSRDSCPYRARTQSPIEVDYHDRLGRFAIEAVSEDGRVVVLYLSMIEACGVSAALRSEIGDASDAIRRREVEGNCGNATRPVGYNGRRRYP